MAESNKTTVIDFSDNHKNAALFFDYVIPFAANPSEDSNFNYYFFALRDIFPLQIQSKEAFHEFLYIVLFYRASIANEIENDPISHDFIIRVACETRKKLDIFLDKYDLTDSIPFDESISNDLCTESYNYTSLKLAQLPLIDTTNAHWEQIIEIREDEKSISKLRNLRLFFNENYSGKEKNFVEDDLCKRLEDYENVTKDWGFDTVTSSIQMLLTSPVTLTSVGSSLAMALFGQPLSALATAGTGSIIEIGKMALHIAKQKKKLSVLQRDHDLAYIIDAKKKLEEK